MIPNLSDELPTTMTGLTEAPEKVCVPVDWLQMDGVDTASYPSSAAVDKTSFYFTVSEAEIYIIAKMLSQIIVEISFQVRNVAVVRIEITDAAGGLRGNFSKPVVDDVSSSFRLNIFQNNFS